MPLLEKTTYPSEDATLETMLQLAATYHQAANCLSDLGKKGPLQRMPGRLLAIHAIELYLSTYLVFKGLTPRETRKYSHDLARRAADAREHGLLLRAKTAAHLEKMTRRRLYLIARYAPEQAATLCPHTRLQSTLEEVNRKVVQAVNCSVVRPATPSS